MKVYLLWLTSDDPRETDSVIRVYKNEEDALNKKSAMETNQLLYPNRFYEYTWGIEEIELE